MNEQIVGVATIFARRSCAFRRVCSEDLASARECRHWLAPSALTDACFFLRRNLADQPLPIAVTPPRRIEIFEGARSLDGMSALAEDEACMKAGPWLRPIG